MGKDELKRLPKNDLVRLVLSLQARLEVLEGKVARSRKDSSTSSKPPSSDIVKPPKGSGKKGSKRTIGGQRGHKKHEQEPLPPEDVDYKHEYRSVECPCCSGNLTGSRREPRVHQQVDLVGRSVKVTERVFFASWCPRCRSHYYPEPPPDLASGYFAPRMKALVAYYKGACHLDASSHDFEARGETFPPAEEL